MIAGLEEWKKIEGYQDRYEVSNYGRVRSLYGKKKSRILYLKPRPLKTGYLRVNLRDNNKNMDRYIHHLVAHAFIGLKPNGYEVNHKDADKKNNTPNNLEYITHAENMIHAKNIGIMLKGSKRSDAKLDENKVRFVRENLGKTPVKQIAEMFKVSPSVIYQVKSRRSWTHVN